MKAVQEIIDYLYLRGLLATADLHDLDAGGLLAGTRAGEAYEADRQHTVRHADEDAADLWRADDLIDQTETRFDRIVGRRPGKSGARLPSDTLSKVALAARIDDCFAAHARRLRPLADLASGLAQPVNLPGALKLLIAADAPDLQRAVAATLSRPGPHFLDLWDAATLRDFRGILNEGEHGPATVAGRAILRGVRIGDLGRYVSEATPALADLMRLMQVQRRILGTVGALLSSSPALFDRPLFVWRDAHACYWALTMAVTALQDEMRAGAAIHLIRPGRANWEYDDLEPDVFEDAVAVAPKALRAAARNADHLETLRCPRNWNVGEGAWHPKAVRAMLNQ